VECDARIDPGVPHEIADRCRAAADAMETEGLDVRFLRCVHLPDHASCVLLFDAGSEAVAEEAARRATGLAARAVRLTVSGSLGDRTT
jgi:hypothetical protein